MELNSLMAHTLLSAQLKALGNLIACVIGCKCVCETLSVLKCVFPSRPCIIIRSRKSLEYVLRGLCVCNFDSIPVSVFN